jgi:hypothetical protein
MRHHRLQGAGRRTHREIDALLPTDQEKLTLRHLVNDAELELVAEGNTGFDQDGNWRIRIDGGGRLVIEVRDGGSWVEQAAFE